MNIAFITSGLLPIPATCGGAIETLLDSFIKQNEIDKKCNITVYSTYNKKSLNLSKKFKYQNTKYIYINEIGNIFIRIINKLLKKNYPINYFFQKRVVKLINKKKYDYVIIENYPELTLKIKNKNVLLYIHSDVFNKETKNNHEILKKCYKVLTVSNYIRNRIVEIDSNFDSKVKIVYNSIDFDNFTDKEYSIYRKNIRKKYGIMDKELVFAYSGRISKEKGVYELVSAFNKSQIPDAKLLIIGGVWYGSKKKNDYLEKIKSISNKNIIFTGYINHDCIQEILCSVDVGVVPSNCNEAAGLSVVEFMSSGCSVIASNKGGISEYVNRKTSCLIEYKNLDDFIDKLSKEIVKFSVNRKNKNTRLENINYSKKFSVKNNYDNIIKNFK